MVTRDVNTKQNFNREDALKIAYQLRREYTDAEIKLIVAELDRAELNCREEKGRTR